LASALGMTPTLIGFDALADDGRIASDVDGAWIEAFTRTEPCTLIMSFTRRQGFLIGRGNQQLTPTVLRQIGRANLWIVGTRSKLLSLDGRPLLLDTDDPDLDEAWSGLVEVVTGYQDSLYYRVEAA
jgi:predicted polyphosphate/ATP-dependent NAD kinase